MALRSLIPVEDIRVAHVNSEDNSTTYESGVAYKAGTMVTYEGAAYVAATDIAEDDTDLPNAAPLKWGLVPNAFTSGSDDSGLATRVSALESEVTDLQSHGNVIIDSVTASVEAGKTLVEALTALGDAALAYIEALEDDDVVIPFLYNLPVAANGSMLAFHCVEQDRYNSQHTARFDATEIRCSSNATNIDIYCTRFGDSSITLQSIQKFSTDSQNTSDLSSTVLTAACTPFIKFMRFKKVT